MALNVSVFRSAPVSSMLLFHCMFLYLVIESPRAAAQIFDDRLVSAMHQDPILAFPVDRVIVPDELRPIWYAALADDDPEMRRLAADTITRAHQLGMQQLGDSAEELLKLLHRKDSDRMTRRAAAKALVEINAEQAAEEFMAQLTTSDLDFAQVVEPALADWDHRPMRDQWLQRLDDPTTGGTRLRLAVTCLGIVREPTAIDDLLRRALDVNGSLPLRLAAARAAGSIQKKGLVDASRNLSRSERVGDRLTAAALIGNHTDRDGIDLLLGMARDDAPAVAGSALRILLEIDPEHVYELAAEAIRNRDVNIRRVGVAALVHRADIESVRLLGPLLDDHNRTLRRSLSNHLIRLAESDALRDAVIEQAVSITTTDQWRGLEQALFVLGTLDHDHLPRG